MMIMNLRFTELIVHNKTENAFFSKLILKWNFSLKNADAGQNAGHKVIKNIINQ